ncbi:ficolin-1-like [Saccostrea echinata]|uniref:ficolin-1-like n=1 Tax=Saccostrea echinata TaxID=191078 RepID=UPI002A7FB486|nr:ficolin-1-like [Saccostrea echinata]
MKYIVSLTFLVFIKCVNITNIEAYRQNGKFVYRGNISYSDESLLLYELSPTITEISLRYCASECYKDLDCNAVEICSSVAGTICRLSKSISTSLVNGPNTCTRHEMEHTCGSVSYYNRRRKICQCVSECDCSTATPSVGGVLSYKLNLYGRVILANCMNTGGHVWTMIQRRVDGSVNFFRGWAEYKSGFGDLNTEFWIGLDNIRFLVTNGFTVLRVELKYGAESVYAEYSCFYIAGEDDNYRIHVSGYSGTAGDGISCTTDHCNNDAQFSTFDNDNDSEGSANHAQRWLGAWWYHDGHRSNLNGEYGNNNHGKGISWFYFKGWSTSLTGSRMMIRRI